MTETNSGKTLKIALISAIVGVLAFLALLGLAGYSTPASLIVGVLVALLVAILLWIGWYEDTASVSSEDNGHPGADVTASGLMATTSIGDEPMSAAPEIATAHHAADTREVRSAAAATSERAMPVADEPAEVVEEPVAEVVAEPVAQTVVVDVADDLKEIKGVGPKIEVQLHERGIVTFAQVAALSATEIEDLGAALKGTSAAQLSKWAEQAKILAAGGETEFSKRVQKGDVY
ncbi:helix-hairpin-helix domain-containing protein [Celeribacter baekdonensis]|uniref:helix-hairpin-helix domain-containing protein n=1 Tax=Celeribacter baekdonensis TaxID=875171 RepID=UPI003A8D122A